MKKIIAFILMFLVVLQVGVSALPYRSNEGYKNTKWGMTKQEVITALPDIKLEEMENGALYFKSQLAGENITGAFAFFDDQLFRVEIRVLSVDGFYNNIPNQFYAYENLLIQKYGEPLERIRKLPPSYDQNSPAAVALAIMSGQGVYRSEWKTPGMDISLLLQSSDPNTLGMNLYLIYESRRLALEQRKLYSQEL